MRRRTAALTGATCTAGYCRYRDDNETPIARFARTFYHASVVFFDYKYGAAAKLPEGSLQRHEAMAATHQRSAERLLHVCRAHGGLYTKLGQFAASLKNILPPQYPKVLAACQDQAPALAFDQIRPFIEEELKCTINEAFSSFDPTALAAASLAQVHRASLLDGSQVAVKVQYPQLAAQVDQIACASAKSNDDPGIMHCHRRICS